MPRRTKPLADVWAASCDTCGVPAGAACRDMRSQTGLLFGRRTHRARAQKLKKMATYTGSKLSVAAFDPSPQTANTIMVTSTGRTGEFWYNTANNQTWTTTTNGWVNVGTTTSITYNTTWEPTIYDYQRADRVWQNWNTTATNTYTIEVQEPIWQRWYANQLVMEEDIEAQRRRADEAQRAREEYSRRQLELARKMEGAQERALELLEMLITPEERLWRDEHPDEIAVRGSDGGLYVIEMVRSVHGNIRQVDEHGCVLGRVCVAPGMYDHQEGGALPLADGWVGQYLAIKCDEATLRRTGNWSSRGQCRHPDVPILGQAA